VDEETCAIRKVLLAARDATAAVLEERTLAGAMASRRRAKAAA
jgi:DNA-binding IscR family transcriptional regulator